MDAINTDVTWFATALVTALIGMIVDFVLGRSRSSELNRHIVVCEADLIDQVDSLLDGLSGHFYERVNSILTIAVSGIASAKMEHEASKRWLDLDLPSLEVAKPQFGPADYKKIRSIAGRIVKLETAAARLRAFRWLFGVLFSLVLLSGALSFLFHGSVFGTVLATILVVTIVVLACFVIYLIRVQDLMDKMEREYGIPAGK